MYQLCGGTFTWDSEKARMNLAKHGVSFEEACEALLDLFHVDEDAGVPEEDRVGTIGYSGSGKLLYVVSAIREDSWRIISARSATPTERKRYEAENQNI